MGDLIGGILGGVGSIAGAVIQSQAADRAAQQALTGYNYITSGAGAQPNNNIIAAGQAGTAGSLAAENAQAQLLGLAPVPGEPSSTTPGGTTGGTPGTPGAASTTMTINGTPNYFGSATGGGGTVTLGPSANNTVINTGATPGTPGATTAGASGGGGVNAPNAFKNYLNSTGYNFQLQQGTAAVDANAASRGLLNSGGTGKALEEYGQNLGSSYFQNYLNQVGNLNTQFANTATAGQNAIGTVTNAGTGAGSNAAQYVAAGGNAVANGVNGALGGFGNAFSSVLAR